mmetsp:Transcript_78590/g.118193  ORF Transcript_78590/g.118193 Transcript_78590/m.118193 type:complete len:583 (-) Transcript_78590:91-1839(-)
MSSSETRLALVRLFKNESSVAEHMKMHKANPAAYASELLNLNATGVSLSAVTKGRAAAVLWRSGDRDSVKSMMSQYSTMGIVEVLTMVKILDSGRKASQLQKKLATCKRMRLTKKLDLTKKMKGLESEGLPGDGCGASGALMKHVRRWMTRIDKSALEFFLLSRPKAPWQELADLAHAKPSDFQLEYFLPSVYGKEAPMGSIHALADQCKSAADVPGLLQLNKSFASCYSWIRTKFAPKTFDVVTKEALAQHIPLEEALWWYQELSGGKVDSILAQRIASGEPLVPDGVEGRGHANFGKLMERLLLFRRKKTPFADMLIPYAEALRRAEAPSGVKGKKVAVFGDASSSMQVAVDAAAIVACSVCSCFDAELSFFTQDNLKAPVLPRSVDQTIEVASKVRASGRTANAASLLPYYQNKQEVDMFVMVTDEQENTKAGGMMFDEMFEAYVKEVYPHAKVYFISFIAQTDPGHMVQLLEKRGLGERVKQFKFDPRLPDLSKLSSLLGMLAMELDDGNMEEDGEDMLEGVVEQVKNINLACLDGELEVPAAAKAVLDKAFPMGTGSVPMETLKGIMPTLMQQGQGG